MILPPDHEQMTDEQLLAALVDDYGYSPQAAEAVVANLRDPDALPLD